MSRRVPAGRGGRSALGAPAVPSCSPAALGAAKELLVELIEELGARRRDPDQAPGVPLTIDPQATLVAPLYALLLPGAERVAKAAQVTAAGLDEARARAQGLAALLTALEELRAQVAGTQLLGAAEQGRWWRALVAALEAALSDPATGQERRSALKIDGADVLLQVKQEGDERRARLLELKRAREAVRAQVAEALLRRRRLQALLDHQDGKEVDPALLDDLAQIYEDHVRCPGPQTPERPRPARHASSRGKAGTRPRRGR